MSSISPINAGASPTPLNRGDFDTRMNKAMQGVADLLGMSTDDLKTAQKNGVTLDQLASQKGVSTDKLVSTLAEGLKENAPPNAPSTVDFTQMATDIAKGTQGTHRHHHGHGHRVENNGENTASGDLASLLNKFGIDDSQFASLLSSAPSQSSSYSSGNSTTNNSTNDFVTQLKSLISQYGSKGLTYDAKA